ncbi:MAG: hypothetical protein SPE19_10425 [Candidatus Faecousia sp.]|nr:hypothetical protein [Candidatus Faecousia sp.]
MIGMTNATGGKDRLRYRVYGGTTPPASPREYDFYIKTTTPITAFELNSWTNAQPTWFVGNGHVYIVSEVWNTDSINLVKDGNGISLPFLPKWCWQQINGQWYQMEAYFYRGGWVKFSDYKDTPPWSGTLFYNGDQYTDITGGWTGADSYSPNLRATLYSGTITISTASAVDLSGFSTLKFMGSGNGANSGGTYSAKCKIVNESGVEVASVDFQSNGTYAVSVAALSGKHYVRFVAAGSRGNNLNISKVWFE